MKECILSKRRLADAFEKAPSIADAVKKLAGKAARGLKIPRTFSVKGLDYDAQRELERLFGTVGQRDSNGRFTVSLLPIFRDQSEWREAMDYFGLSDGKGAGAEESDPFERLRLLHPTAGPFVDMLAANEEIVRFATRPGNARTWIRLHEGFVDHLLSRRITTLSQLGSDVFGDSKSLRSGPLRRQLVLMAAALSNADSDDERKVLEGALIVDNPYTSFVTFCAPVAFTLYDGTRFTYPEQYFERGMAVQIPLETALEIEEIEWLGDAMELVTCENAAPFVHLVSECVPCVYTAGYPCIAVKHLLHLLSEIGVTCVHEGDADLDGFRIAAEVGAEIDVTHVVASEALAQAPDDFGIELSPEQSKRAWSFLASPQADGFAYADDIRRMLSRGRWIEQESFSSIPGLKGEFER